MRNMCVRTVGSVTDFLHAIFHEKVKSMISYLDTFKRCTHVSYMHVSANYSLLSTLNSVFCSYLISDRFQGHGAY